MAILEAIRHGLRWGVQEHSGDMAWSYEVKCSECGYYFSWGYDDH